MTRNLNTPRYRTEEIIPNVTSGWYNLTTGARCYYNNDSASFAADYGALYNWYAVDRRTVCLTGWHVPSDAEWNSLSNYLGEGSVSGGKMKETGTARWISPNTGASDLSGFTGLPGGRRMIFDGYADLRYNGYWWTAAPNNNNALQYFLSFENEILLQGNCEKFTGNSVRCVKNNYANRPPYAPSGPIPYDNSLNQYPEIALSWICSDYEGDSLTYDVYPDTLAIPVAHIISGIDSTDYTVPGSLLAGKTYYWKVVAHDDHSHSTSGPVWIFSTRAWQCGDSIEYSGQVYSSIQIGAQCWMGQNLNAGTQVPGATAQTNDGNIQKHCYNNEADSCAIYGGLYQWDEMMNYSATPGARGICPPGWHVPDVDDWDALSSSPGGNTAAGGHIKATGFRHWMLPNTGADNSSGFAAYAGGTYRPAGYQYFYLIREGGIYWTSNPSGSYAIRRDLSYLNAEINPYTCERYHSFSVRCLKDQ